MKVNDYLMSQRDTSDPKVYMDDSFPLAKRITCADGFSISVQASHGAYCRPRTNVGPWSAVECGFPSATPTSIMSHCENPDNPTETVYGYVPIELVDELLDLHGGFEPK